MKGRRGICLLVLLSLLAGTLAMPAQSEAKTVSAEYLTNMYCDGRYVYYTGESTEPPMGIMRLDTKTGKVKQIFRHWYKGKETNGFKNIAAKENYIYCMWDHMYGSGTQREYIYRIQKDGRNAKRLAVGCRPKIVGDRIYYTKCKVKVDIYDGVKYTETVGAASMKLDGSDKRMERGVKLSKKTSSAVSIAYTEKKDAATGDNYYYLEDKSHKLMRLNLKTGKSNTVYRCESDEEVDYFMAHKSAVILILKCDPFEENEKYIDQKKVYVNQMGKKKVVLRKTNFCN